jgi:hypothetical protein
VSEVLLSHQTSTPPEETHNSRQPSFLTEPNLLSNFAWGDKLNLEKPENTFRVYGLNPNGFPINQKGGDITEFFMMASSIIDADFVGCAEHNLDFTQHRVQESAYQAIRNTVEHSKATWSTTPIPFDNTYKPGGTMSCVLGNAIARVKEAG